MKKNIGTIDKAIRILAAVIILILFFSNLISGTVAILFLALSAVFIFTGFMAFCPLYFPFGITTRNKKS